MNSDDRSGILRRASLVLAVGALTALSACTNEAGLAGIAPPGSLETSVALASTGTSSPATQAYAGETSSKAEASTESLIRKPATGSTAGKKSRTLFQALKENNQRAGKTNKKVAKHQPATRSSAKVETSTRLASTRRPAVKNRGVAIDLPGVRTAQTIAPRPDTSTLGYVKSKAKSLLVKPVEVASAAALGRLGSNGLRRQHSKVSVKCLRPGLVRLIKRAERHFGRHAVVTSGYRSPRHNRRVGGARKSMHVSCMAADVQIKGVSKWKLAKWFRAQSGRGGVGTYCHTQSVHVDIGKERDWNWRCKRRRGKRRKA